jgi:hypothetical protein
MLMTLIRPAALIITTLLFYSALRAQNNASPGIEKAEAVLTKAVQSLGGEHYLQAKSQIGRGKYSVLRDKNVVSFQSFTDVIVFPDKERTEFKGTGSRTVQANAGDTGWIFDGDQKLIKEQNAAQIGNFKQALRTSLDYLLKGPWRNEGTLAYIGKRLATLGKRNDVVKLSFQDGFAVEFEFASDNGLPQKSIYSTTAVDGEIVKEEDRYAQFVDVNGIKAPFIVDRFRNGTQVSRINYESIEFNKAIPDTYFVKPNNPKDAGKELKF